MSGLRLGQATAPAQRRAGITARPPRLLIADGRTARTGPAAIDPDRARKLLGTSGFLRPSTPVVIVYRLESGEHRQTGLVLETSVDDYRNGHIRRHEETRPERERRLDRFTEASGVEQMPVMLAHPERDGLRSLLAGVTEAKPDVRVVDAGQVVHSVWIRHGVDLIGAVQAEVDAIETLYIADGHHRMAAAERYAGRRNHLGPEHPGAFTLAALFPCEQMRVLGYHRCFPLPDATTPEQVLAGLAAASGVERLEECGSSRIGPQPGMIAVRCAGGWYRLWLRPPEEAGDVRTSLDAVALAEQLIPAVFHAADRAASSSGIPAARGAETGHSGCWCAEENSITFLPHPPTVDQVMAVSDAGLLMPAKSTFFDPKASNTLFARDLRS